MKSISEGFLRALGIALGLGIISLVFSGYPWFQGGPFGNNELPVLEETEYQELKTVTRKVPSEHEGMFLHKITGSVTLNNKNKYKEAEVIVSLYNTDGIFIGQYSSGPQYISKQEDLEFSIDVWEPYSADEIVDQKFKITAK